ncbi:MAG: tRNA1(Val) (adenine(37)-N6)-methyltransferase [Bacteroidales bacterium]
MSSNAFRFKQFNVLHDACSMKVNTDGVLLGAWADEKKPYDILDIGTGSGVIALMLAQRFACANIEAIEIHKESALQANKNFALSVWKKRLQIIHADFIPFAQRTRKEYDLIVSNPPYFNNSLLSPNNNRNTARHTCNLSYEDLLYGVSKLLSRQGNFCVILPSSEFDYFTQTAKQQRLFLNKRLSVANTKEVSPKRLLLQFSKTETPNIFEDFLAIREKGTNEYSLSYKMLTQAFYLHF